MDPYKYDDIDGFGYVPTPIDGKKLQVHFDVAPTMFWLSQVEHKSGPVHMDLPAEPYIAIPMDKIDDVIELLEQIRDWKWGQDHKEEESDE